MWPLEVLLRFTGENQVKTPGGGYRAIRPISDRPKYRSFWRRLVDAHVVLTGRASAFTWPEDEVAVEGEFRR